MSVFRRTKVIATIGPSSSSPEMGVKLIEAGVNVFRINMSHASHDEFRARIKMVRDAEKSCASAVGVIADLQGPKLRIGQLEAIGPQAIARAGSPSARPTHERRPNPRPAGCRVASSQGTAHGCICNAPRPRH